MSTTRQKSTTSTSSSSSSGSSSTSGSSSCSETGSSSSDTETTSSGEDKSRSQIKIYDANPKSNTSSNSKICEIKPEIKVEENVTLDYAPAQKARVPPTGVNRFSRLNTISSEDDIEPVKKSNRPSSNNATGNTQKKKVYPNSVITAQSQKSSSYKASMPGAKQTQSKNVNTQSAIVTSVIVKPQSQLQSQPQLHSQLHHQPQPYHQVQPHHQPQPHHQIQQHHQSQSQPHLQLHHQLQPHHQSQPLLSADVTSDIPNTQNPNVMAPTMAIDIPNKDVTSSNINVIQYNNAVQQKCQMIPPNTNDHHMIQSERIMPQPKKNLIGKNFIQQKSSDESDSDTGSLSETTSTSDSESSDSSNSFMSAVTKYKRSVNSNILAHAQIDDATVATQDTTRKLTRSISSRHSQQQIKNTSASGVYSESDSDDVTVVTEMEPIKRYQTTSPIKKQGVIVTGISKNKNKKDHFSSLQQSKLQLFTPPQRVERKCPIEGCDSSGHLGGILDRHFLIEACPIYHNTTAADCRSRANDRKIRDDQRQKIIATMAAVATGTDIATNILAPEQKEFLTRIRESRSRFRSMASTINSELLKSGRYYTEEDREPHLIGIASDYDLMMFREAQSIASMKIEEELKDLPLGKGIKYITMGKYKMKVWYQSPYPDDTACLSKMYICEFCLRYQKSETCIKRHAQKCVWRHPPGDEIYRKGKLQVWQVDGKKYKQYCQHLCLLAKFFLDHKTLYYDVEPFLFYIMTLADMDGCHTVGYFSKEKNSFYNVSCILTLPPYQRKGYGRLLIDFSYLLTRVEGKIGSPEKPLSDLGLISYRSYWKDVLLDYLCNRSGNTLSIKDVSQEMAIYSYDIVSTLQALGMMKYWKGKHIVLKKQDVLDEYEERVKRRGNFPKIDPTCLRWKPFVPTQPTTAP